MLSRNIERYWNHDVEQPWCTRDSPWWHFPSSVRNYPKLVWSLIESRLQSRSTMNRMKKNENCDQKPSCKHWVPVLFPLQSLLSSFDQRRMASLEEEPMNKFLPWYCNYLLCLIHGRFPLPLQSSMGKEHLRIFVSEKIILWSPFSDENVIAHLINLFRIFRIECWTFSSNSLPLYVHIIR